MEPINNDTAKSAPTMPADKPMGVPSALAVMYHSKYSVINNNIKVRKIPACGLVNPSAIKTEGTAMMLIARTVVQLNTVIYRA